MKINLPNSDIYTKSEDLSKESKSPLLKINQSDFVRVGRYSMFQKAPIWQIMIFEFIGMFIFVYGITCTPDSSSLDFQISISLFLGVLYSAVYSGGHLNTAISAMFYIKKEHQIKLKTLIIYIVSQFAGALTGGLLAYYYHDSIQSGFLPIQDGVGYLFQLAFGQAFGSFVLLFFVLILTNKNTTFTDNQIQTTAVFCLYVFIGRRFSPRSGMSLNICVSVTFAILAYIGSQQKNHFQYLWIYVFGDLLGMLIATKFYDHIYQPYTVLRRMEKQEQQQVQQR